MKFTINALAMAAASLGVLLIIAFTGASYIHEDNWWILSVELLWAGGSVVWGIQRLIKDVKDV